MTVAVRVTATITGHRRCGVAEHELTLDLERGAVRLVPLAGGWRPC